MTGKQLTTEEVERLFDAREVGDVGAPRFAVGGAALDFNQEGYQGTDALADAMKAAPYVTEESVQPDLQEGGRRRRRRTRKQKGGKRRSFGKKPRFQLTLKATIRLRSRSRKQR
jgi:hypothetical protein